MRSLWFYLYHPDLAAPVLIKHDPVGWDSLGKTVKRDMKWGGVFFEYTPELKWIKDGRRFIQYYYEKYFVEAEITMSVYEFNTSTRKKELVYTGRLNLTKVRFTKLYAVCNSEQTGFTQTVVNGQETKVEHDAAQLTVALPQKVVLQKFARDKQARTEPDAWEGARDYNINETVSENLLFWKSLQNSNVGNQPAEGAWWTEIPRDDLGLPVLSFNVSTGQTWYIFPAFGDNELSFDEIKQRFTYGLHATQDEPVEFLKYFWIAEFAGVYKFNFDTWVKLTKTSMTGTFRLVLKYGKPENYTTEIVATSNDMAVDIYPGADNYSVKLSAGDQIYIYWQLIVTTATFVDINFVEDYIDLLAPIPANFTTKILIDAETIFPASGGSVNLPFECFKATVEKVTGKTDVFKSDYYGRTDSTPAYAADGEGSLRGILNGSHVRGFPRSTNKLATSLKELIEFGQCVDGIGVGIEKYGMGERVVVEKLAYFFKKIRIAQLANVRDIEKAVMPDMIFNKLEGGYDKNSKQGIGNTDDVHGKRTYNFPITQLQNKPDMVSPYHASAYLIEEMRRDSYNKSKSKATDLDTDNFVIQLYRAYDGLRVELGSDFGAVSFVQFVSSLCNVRLSPMRNLKRNGSMIRTALYKREGLSIELNPGAAGNTAMWSKLPTETEYVKENSIAITDLEKPFLLPELYTFKAPLSRDVLQAINNEPTGYIEFAGDASAWKQGFIVSMAPAPKSLLTEFTLIRASL